MGELLYPPEKEYSEKSGIGWYKSKDPIPIKHPFVGGGYISNKKWPLIEVCTESNLSNTMKGTIRQFPSVFILQHEMYLNVFRLCPCIS